MARTETTTLTNGKGESIIVNVADAEQWRSRGYGTGTATGKTRYNFEKHSMSELKRWAEQIGVGGTGKKQDVIERLVEAEFDPRKSEDKGPEDKDPEGSD